MPYIDGTSVVHAECVRALNSGYGENFRPVGIGRVLKYNHRARTAGIDVDETYRLKYTIWHIKGLLAQFCNLA
jgi:hypothetical protein